MPFKEQLCAALEQQNLPCDGTAVDNLCRYHQHLLAYNEHTNLTAITEPQEMIQKHYVDSLLGLSLLPTTGRVIDVGCGAGLPGMPLKIFRPALQMTLLDASQKRLRFLDQVIELLTLEQTETLHARAEMVGQDAQYREQFDVALSRAVASLPMLLEYCLPLVCVGGHLLAYKGPGADEELEKAANALQILGGKLVDDKAFTLADGSRRRILLFQKVASCSPRYPRNSKQMKAKSL